MELMEIIDHFDKLGYLPYKDNMVTFAGLDKIHIYNDLLTVYDTKFALHIHIDDIVRISDYSDHITLHFANKSLIKIDKGW